MDSGQKYEYFVPSKFLRQASKKPSPRPVLRREHADAGSGGVAAQANRDHSILYEIHTLGAALSSPENWTKAGCWCDCTYKMAVDEAGHKRRPLRACARRVNELVDTFPSYNVWRKGPKKGLPDEELSRMYRPEWLNVEYGEGLEEDKEQKALMLSRYDEGSDEAPEGRKL